MSGRQQLITMSEQLITMSEHVALWKSTCLACVTFPFSSPPCFKKNQTRQKNNKTVSIRSLELAKWPQLDDSFPWNYKCTPPHPDTFRWILGLELVSLCTKGWVDFSVPMYLHTRLVFLSENCSDPVDMITQWLSCNPKFLCKWSQLKSCGCLTLVGERFASQSSCVAYKIITCFQRHKQGFSLIMNDNYQNFLFWKKRYLYI